jgi:hypothetical protein
MHRSGAFIFKRALFVDGTFCVVAGLLLALSAGWLESELPAPGWFIVTAGLVSAGWGALLIAASRMLPTRSALGAVAIVNWLVVVATLAWLALEGGDMSGVGLAAVGILGISVLRFAVYQSMVLRQ